MNRRKFLGSTVMAGAALPFTGCSRLMGWNGGSLSIDNIRLLDEAELIVDAGATLGEGPIWDEANRVLYWLDIESSELHEFDPATGEDRFWNLGQQIGTVVPCQSGGVMLALHEGFAHFDTDVEKLTLISNPEAHMPTTRFNDGKCDPAGRFWAGTLSMANEGNIASIYMMAGYRSVRRMLGDITCSNGINWSPDNKTMYFIDTPTHKVDAFDYDIETGNISNRRPVIEMPVEIGYPDGMTIDTEGMLWIAPWGAGKVIRCNPKTGEYLAAVPCRALQTTACAFGGPDLRDLYITTAAVEAGMPRGENAGGLFRARPGSQGHPMPPFAG